MTLSITTIPSYPLILREDNTNGSPLSNHCVLILDFENYRWAFRHFTLQPDISINRASIMPLPQDGNRIAGTFHQSLNGIRVGDEVVAIECIDLQERSICDVINGDLKKEISYKPITVRTRKGKVEHTIYPRSEPIA